jgi:hypothetical protein
LEELLIPSGILHLLNNFPQLLGGGHLVDNDANTTFLSACQYKYGGIAKEPGETAGEPLNPYVVTRNEAASVEIH